MSRTLALLFILSAARVEAQSTYPYAYFRHVEGSVTIQRATESDSEEVGLNLPAMPGDRVWTRDGARAEIEFEDGSLLRLDERTKVDFVSLGDRNENLLRQWSGSTILKLVDDRGGRFRIDTPGGSIFPASSGAFRIDVDDGGDLVTLSTFDGVAELASEGGSVLVRSGQRSIARDGSRPEAAFEFNTARWDDFASWSDDLDRRTSRTRELEGVPAPVSRYAGYLGGYGDWRYDTSLGYVWYPTVSVGWSPYTHGRWAYTSYGWTWCSYDPWGWAPFHYGRWGYGSFGWYWIPGAYWGPAWVSWAIGPRWDWVGWCPLGYYDRPVFAYDHVYRGGHAVPRSQAGVTGWTFVRGNALASASVSHARLRVEDVRDTAQQGQLLESGAILDRGLRPRVVGAAAMTRIPRGGLSEVSRREPQVGRAPTSIFRSRGEEDATEAVPRARAWPGTRGIRPDAGRERTTPSEEAPPSSEPSNVEPPRVRTRSLPPGSWGQVRGRGEPQDGDGGSVGRPEPRPTRPTPDGRQGPQGNDEPSARARGGESRRNEGGSRGGAVHSRPRTESSGPSYRPPPNERSRGPSSGSSARPSGSSGSQGGHSGGAAATRKPREK